MQLTIVKYVSFFFNAVSYGNISNGMYGSEVLNKVFLKKQKQKTKQKKNRKSVGIEITTSGFDQPFLYNRGWYRGSFGTAMV